MKVTLYQGDTPNVNGWVYPTSSLIATVELSSTLIVVLDSYPPQSHGIDLSKAVAEAHLSMEGDNLVAEISVINTHLSSVFQDLVSSGDVLIMPCAVGTFTGDKTFNVERIPGLTAVPKTKVCVGENPAGLFEVNMVTIDPK